MRFQKAELMSGLVVVKLAYVLQAGIHLLKVNNRNTRTRCELC